MSTTHSGEGVAVSTSSLRLEDRVDFWIDQVARTLVQIECGGEPGEGIDATLTRREFALFGACDIAANPHSVVRTPHSIRLDHRDSIFVCLMNEGRGYTFQGGECMMHGPGDLVIYDVTRPYGHGFPGNMSMTVLDVPRPVFEAHVGPWRRRDLFKIDHSNGITQWASRRIHALLTQPSPTAFLAREQMAAQVLELLQSIVRVDSRSISTTRSSLQILQRAKDFIEAHLADETLDAHAVSRAVGLSPRQLFRIFEIEGAPVTRHIWNRRLERCRMDLRDPALKHLTISEIAFRWGFNNSAHFSRVYRTRFGETPTRTRTPL